MSLKASELINHRKQLYFGKQIEVLWQRGEKSVGIFSDTDNHDQCLARLFWSHSILVSSDYCLKFFMHCMKCIIDSTTDRSNSEVPV